MADVIEVNQRTGSGVHREISFPDGALAELAALTTGGAPVPVADQAAMLALTGKPYGFRVRWGGFTYELTNPAAPSSAGSWQAIPKVYRALLNQTGTDAPTATVLTNDLSAAIVWTKEVAENPGVYLGTLSGAFAGNVWCNQPSFNNGNDVNITVRLVKTSANVLTLATFNAGDTVLDFGAVSPDAMMLEILVYP